MNSHRNPRNQRAVGGDAGNPGGQQLLSGPGYAVASCHPKGGAS
jgi:hypothetical protein